MIASQSWPVLIPNPKVCSAVGNQSEIAVATAAVGAIQGVRRDDEGQERNPIAHRKEQGASFKMTSSIDATAKLVTM